MVLREGTIIKNPKNVHHIRVNFYNFYALFDDLTSVFTNESK